MAAAAAAAFPPISRRSSPATGSRGRWRCGAGTPGEGDRKLVRTLLIDNYDSYTYNIFQDLAVINGVPPVVVHNDEWTWGYLQHQLYDEMAFDNIVISPGPGSPTCPADVGVCLEVLLKCEDLPILGVCLGHQALGFIHGAQIVHAREPIHGRLSEIEHTGCYLFDGIPSGRKSGFKVVRYHSLIIDHDTLPKDLIPIAWTVSRDAIPFLEILDPKASNTHNYRNQFAIDCLEESTSENMKLLMGIRHSTRPHYGLQFHPESIATRHGRQIFKNFKKLTVNHGLRSSAHPQRKVSFEHNLRKRVTNGSNGNLHSKFSSQYHSIQNPATKLPVRRKTKHLKLQWRKFGKLASQVGGPENIFLGLFGDLNGKDTFWLDSSSTEMRRARFSFMGGKGGQLWKQLSFWLCNHRSNHGGYLTIQDATGLEETTYLEDGFLDFLEKELQSFQYNKEDFQGLPFHFHGGFVGFIGYDLKIECGASSNIHKSTKPDACLFFVDNLVVIDHWGDDVYILSIHSSDTGEAEKQKWLDETERRLLDLKALAFRNMHKMKSQSTILSKSLKPGFVVAKSRDQYVNDVKKCLQFIRDGESYELCLTTQMKMKLKNLNALELYLDLRKQNPAPYAAWLNFSKEKLSICCSSPERFLQLDGTGILEAKPIKGTISRGTTPEEDEHQRNKLRSSEKDQAENLMIVDLLRNDLGRVCEPGTVHVPCLMDVESYATVHTLVSTIRGRKKAGLSSVDCVKAAFPGGSMTGAPKHRSMELLDSLECCSRGVYSGSIGFFSYNQTFDLNIVIRTVVVHDDEASIGAGGAVVALSNPEDEYDEMVLKAKAPTKAVERQWNKMDSPDRVEMAKESRHLLSH